MRAKLLVSLLVLVLSAACAGGAGNSSAPPPAVPVVVTQVVIQEVTSTPEPPTAPPPVAEVPTKDPATFVVSAKLVKNADCHSGPDSTTDVVSSFTEGQVLEVVGRNPDVNNTWWVVVIPGGSATCWLSYPSALAKGDFGKLAVVTEAPVALTYPVQATLIKDANCRTGPATTFGVAAILAKGQVVQIIGRNPDFNNTWWVVKLPDSPITCWLSIASAQAAGDFGSLPTVTPP